MHTPIPLFLSVGVGGYPQLSRLSSILGRSLGVVSGVLAFCGKTYGFAQIRLTINSTALFGGGVFWGVLAISTREC